MHSLLEAASLQQQSRRLAQLSDDNAFLDVEAIFKSDATAVLASVSSSASQYSRAGTLKQGLLETHFLDDEDDTRAGGDLVQQMMLGSSAAAAAVRRASNLKRGRGCGGNTTAALMAARVHVASSLSAQHEEYVEQQKRAWSEAEALNASQLEEDEGLSGAGRGRGRKTRRKAKGRDEVTTDEGREVEEGCGRHKVSDTRVYLLESEERVSSSSRATSFAAIAGAAEELRILRAWKLLMRDPFTATTTIAPPRRHADDTEEGSLLPSSSSRNSLHALLQEEQQHQKEKDERAKAALKTSNEINGNRGEPRRSNAESHEDILELPHSLAPSSLLLLAKCPSQLAMTAAPVEHQEVSAAGVRMLVTAAVGSIPAQTCVEGVQSHHLCSVCLLPAAYRCLRCKTALFCSVDCHVKHDAMRCMKFIV